MEYAQADSIALYDANTIIHCKSPSFILHECELETYTVDGHELTKLIRNFGYNVEIRDHPEVLYKKANVMGTGEKYKLWAKIQAPHLLSIKMVYDAGDTVAISYCGRFSIVWESDGTEDIK